MFYLENSISEKMKYMQKNQRKIKKELFICLPKPEQEAYR